MGKKHYDYMKLVYLDAVWIGTHPLYALILVYAELYNKGDLTPAETRLIAVIGGKHKEVTSFDIRYRKENHYEANYGADELVETSIIQNDSIADPTLYSNNNNLVPSKPIHYHIGLPEKRTLYYIGTHNATKKHLYLDIDENSALSILPLDDYLKETMYIRNPILKKQRRTITGFTKTIDSSESELSEIEYIYYDKEYADFSYTYNIRSCGALQILIDNKDTNCTPKKDETLVVTDERYGVIRNGSIKLSKNQKYKLPDRYTGISSFGIKTSNGLYVDCSTADKSAELDLSGLNQLSNQSIEINGVLNKLILDIRALANLEGQPNFLKKTTDIKIKTLVITNTETIPASVMRTILTRIWCEYWVNIYRVEIDENIALQILNSLSMNTTMGIAPIYKEYKELKDVANTIIGDNEVLDKLIANQLDICKKKLIETAETMDSFSAYINADSKLLSSPSLEIHSVCLNIAEELEES